MRASTLAAKKRPGRIASLGSRIPRRASWTRTSTATFFGATCWAKASRACSGRLPGARKA